MKANITTIMTKEMRWFLGLFKPIACILFRFARKIKSLCLQLYFKIHFALIESQWTYSQKDYVKWANSPLPEDYIKQIQRLGKMFHDFIGDNSLTLDVGCGNGLLGGKSYEEIGYSYLEENAVGVDPLPLLGPKPKWLSEYTRGISEKLAFRSEVFDSIVLATTLDHIENISECLDECKRVLRKTGSLNIWLTCIKDFSAFDLAHSNRFTKESLTLMLDAHGWQIIKTFVERFSDTGDTVFIKAKKR